MKIRIIGTSEECAAAREYYSGLEKQENVQSVSISLDNSQGNRQKKEKIVDKKFK